MKTQQLRNLLEQVRSGASSLDAALDQLATLPFEQVEGLGRIDHQRELRSGCPEVVFGESKSAQQIAALLERLGASERGALATRVSADKAQAVAEVLPAAVYNPVARTLRTPGVSLQAAEHDWVAVVCAGTSDIPVAREAEEVLDFLGHAVRRFDDVGVAGLQRVVSVASELREASVILIAAGMEGALPSVVSGLVKAPIIAIPTSVGYGVGLGGFVAMQSMLATCSPGVSVVNIDNGFGAAVCASRMIQMGAVS